MMNSQTYVSDPKIWEAFYKNMAEKKFNPYKYKPRQIGRGMKNRKSYVIPIRPHSQLESQQIPTQVTPMAVVEERARIEHINDVEKGIPHVNLKKGIKGKRKQPSVSPLKEPKRLTSSKKKKNTTQRRKKQNVSTPLKKRKYIKQKQTLKEPRPTQTKVLSIDSYKNIFND
jgi:hypothetical protein